MWGLFGNRPGKRLVEAAEGWLWNQKKNANQENSLGEVSESRNDSAQRNMRYQSDSSALERDLSHLDLRGNRGAQASRVSCEEAGSLTR